jgi:hypothetical protein
MFGALRYAFNSCFVLYRAGAGRGFCQNPKIKLPCPHIERAHKLRDGTLVYFDDGKIAFSPRLLFVGYSLTPSNSRMLTTTRK